MKDCDFIFNLTCESLHNTVKLERKIYKKIQLAVDQIGLVCATLRYFFTNISVFGTNFSINLHIISFVEKRLDIV